MSVTGYPYAAGPGGGTGRLVLWNYPASRKILVLAGLPFMLFFVGLTVALLYSSSANGAAGFAFLAAVLLVSLTASMAYRIVRVFRYAVLLDGTALVERGVFKSRGCDLTRSFVNLGAYPLIRHVTTAGGGMRSVRTSTMIPALTAMDGRQAVRLNLLPPLAPWKLLALADAITARGQRQDPAAWQVAGTLRQWAGAPVDWPGGVWPG